MSEYNILKCVVCVLVAKILLDDTAYNQWDISKPVKTNNKQYNGTVLRHTGEELSIWKYERFIWLRLCCACVHTFVQKDEPILNAYLLNRL